MRPIRVRKKRGPAQIVAATGVVLGMIGALATIVVQGHAVTAAPVSMTLNYNCTFPLIGAQPLTVEIHSDMPTSIAPGTPTGAFQINAVATVSETARLGLRTVGAATLEGTVQANANLAVPGLNLPITMDMTIPQVAIPTASGAFPTNASGSTPSLTFTPANAGTATITVGDLVMNLTPKAANGQPTGLGTFESVCTVAPGQNQVLHSFTVTGGATTTTATSATTATTATTTTSTTRPTTASTATTSSSTTSTTRATTSSSTSSSTTSTTRSTSSTSGPSTHLNLRYNATGSSRIGAANGNVPLSGSIAADFDLSAGTHVSQLTLAPTTGKFTVLGLIPTTAKIEFVPTGPTTGALVDGRLTTRSEVTIKLTNVSLFNILPIASGANCQTSTPAVIELASPAGELFNPQAGGNLEGTFNLPALAQGSCGWLTGIVSLFMAGPNNTINLQLTAA
jgi:hypothetical protein